MTRTTKTAVLAIIIGTSSALAFPTPDTLWELNGNLDTSIGTAASLGAVGGWAPSYEAVDGSAGAEVLNIPAFSPTQWLFADTADLPANGGGSFVNNYSIVMDVKLDSIGSFQSLYQTNEGNSNDGDSFVDGSGGLGISSDYAGSLVADTWYRIAIVNDLTGTDNIRYYVNGSLVNSAENLSVDGRWSIYPDIDSRGVLLFADESNETGSMSIDNIALYDTALSDTDASDLGAAGSPIPEPASALLTGLAMLTLLIKRRR